MLISWSTRLAGHASSRSFRLDLASAYHQFRIRAEDKTSFRVPGGQYEFRVGAFGLHGISSLLMRYMHAIFLRPVMTFDEAALRPWPAKP